MEMTDAYLQLDCSQNTAKLTKAREDAALHDKHNQEQRPDRSPVTTEKLGYPPSEGSEVLFNWIPNMAAMQPGLRCGYTARFSWITMSYVGHSNAELETLNSWM